MEQTFTDTEEDVIVIDSGNPDFSDTPTEPPPEQIPVTEPPAPEEPHPITPDSPEETETSEQTDAVPTPIPTSAPVIEIDLQPVIDQLTKLQETTATIQTDIEKQTKSQNEYFRYSFIVFFMIFCALVIYLIFSKVQV